MTHVNITSKNGAVLKTAGKYCQDDIDISLKDADKLIPNNIKEGVSILGVEGTLTDDLWAQWFNRTLTKGVVPEGSTSIPDYGFYRQKKMTSITIPDSVTGIGSYAFLYCSNLSSVNISESGSNLTIGGYALTSCYSITAIKLPKRVISASVCAFYGCTNLTQVVIENPSLNMHRLSNGKSGTWVLCNKLANIQVPQGFISSMDLYCQTVNKIPQGVPLTKECLHQIITNYADMTGKTSPILYIYPNNAENITDEDRELAQFKNITIKLIES